MTDTEWVHPAVRKFAIELGRDADHEVTIDRVANQEWRLILDNGRVRMTVDYRLAGRGRLVHAGTTLALDGKPHPTAKSYDAFIWLFKNPDTPDMPPEPEQVPGEPTPIGDPVDPDRAPEKIRHIAKVAADKMPAGARVRIGRTPRRWILAIDGDHYTIRLSFCGGRPDAARPHKETPVHPTRRRHVELWINGEDHTDQVDGRIERAFAILAGKTPHQGAPSAPAVNSERVAAVNTGVNVRKQTVIRV